MSVAFQNSVQEKGRPQEAGAKVTGKHGVAPRENSSPFGTATPLGMNSRAVQGEAARSFQSDSFRNVRGQIHRTIPSGDFLTTEQVTKAICSTLIPFPAKKIVTATGGSIRAAENIRQGMNAMSLVSFLNACRHIPELRALAMEMMGCEAETDPEFVRGLSLLMNSYVRKRTSEAFTGNSPGDNCASGEHITTGDLFEVAK